MATSVPGLFAIGNACYTGSAIVGAVPASPGRMHGSGLTGAVWMGTRAGAAAVVDASRADQAHPDGGRTAELERVIYAPLGRATGVAPRELMRLVQAAMSPIGYSVCKSAERMEEALTLVLEAKRRVPELGAIDPHHLSACNEAKSMVLCAELFYRTSLARTESRGWHVREDYPERDDRDWLKWVVVKDAGGEMDVSTEAVPLDRYPIRP
jgi:succinate dehydrogenase/fumarate reductase flavoprotein subunit